MAYWDGHRIVATPPERYNDAWLVVDHGCCNGILWGGDYPRECNCNMGQMFVHIKSGMTAVYPGGPIVEGRLNSQEVNGLLARTTT